MVEFKISTNATKKYMAKTPSGRWVHFGSRSHQHFKDSTGLGKYSHLDHNDPKRRANYRTRHGAIKLKDGRLAYKDKESPAYYSWHYLW